ncbi:MAG: hypothetical protein K0Q54_2608 [Methylobacterium brachiatum]|jgi:hypothetical protein|nr:hypothetical protein [Methylobacterium brachiatum]
MTKPTTAKAARPTDDLRRRAAGARDAAGRFIKRIAPAKPSAPATEPDPALAAATVFRASWNALGEVLNAEAPDDMTAELQDAQGAAFDRLCAVRPTTPEGFRALAQCWAMMLQGERGSEPGLTISDAAADSLIAGAGVCVPFGSMFDRADPTHALISAHRYAYAEWDRLSAVWNGMALDDPGYAAAMAASKEPGEREVAAYDALFTARPTSLAGAAALASYLGEAVRRTRIDAEPSEGERALGTIAAALKGLAPAAEAPPHPDAALFALGAEFVAAWAVEEESPDDTGYWACNRVAQQIVRTPAATAAGLGIKALLLARLDEDDSSPRNPVAAHGPIASHWNVLRQVQEGAARIAAGTETGIPATADTPAGPSLVALLDLPSATLDELLTVRDLADHVGSVAYASAWSPRCHQRANTHGAPYHNDAGKLMQWLGDALTDVEAAVDKEVAGRAPSNRVDRETRLLMLAGRTIEDGDPDTIKAFALELLDHASAESRGH